LTRWLDEAGADWDGLFCCLHSSLPTRLGSQPLGMLMKLQQRTLLAPPFPIKTAKPLPAHVLLPSNAGSSFIGFAFPPYQRNPRRKEEGERDGDGERFRGSNSPNVEFHPKYHSGRCPL